MILAVDVDYRNTSAIAAGVCFASWEDPEPSDVLFSKIESIAGYESGEFYKREMPCIVRLLNEHHLSPSVIVIDGFVVLGEEERPGLGMHLFNELEQKIAIIGVAKTAFKGVKPETELLRGESKKPLYISAVGVALAEAKQCVASMHGRYRLPTLLKRVDYECRNFSAS